MHAVDSFVDRDVRNEHDTLVRHPAPSLRNRWWKIESAYPHGCGPPFSGARLKTDKGINLPDSELQLPALTAKDEMDLDFVVRHADLVGLSFVNREADVIALIEQLRARTDKGPGIVLKIDPELHWR